MVTTKLNNWLSFGANMGVVLGLVLVAYQINQEAELTKIQLFSEATSSRKEFNQALMGSDPLQVVAKSIERPNELTLAELKLMDFYFISALNELRRLELLREAGLAVDDAEVEGFHVFYFGSNFAQAWFKEYGGENEFAATRERIRNTDPDWVVDFFDRVLGRLDDDSGQSLSRDSALQK
jgi:hypothetical protein